MAAADDRETTIFFTDADEDMQIATANRKLKGRLKKLGFEPEESEDGSDFYTVPRAFLQIRKPRDMDLSEEEKEERRERLREARKAAGIGEFAKKKAKPKAKAKAKPEPEDDDEELEDEDEDEAVDYHSLGLAQLRAFAKEQGLRGGSAKTKKEIIAELDELFEGSEDEGDDEYEEDDEEEVEVVRPKARSSSARKPSARKPAASTRKRR